LAFAENVDRGFVIQTQLHHPAQHTIVKRRRHLGFVTCNLRVKRLSCSSIAWRRSIISRVAAGRCFEALLAEISRIDIIVVYKVDRLTRSLADFTRLVETFDTQGVSFVSVTQ